MRTMTLLLCLALAGCAGASASSPSLAPEAPKPAVADPPLLPGPAGQPAEPKRARGKSKQAKSGDAPKEEWWQEGGVTREKINAMCWMKFEKGHGDLPIDKRADLVNQCVAETLKEHPIR
jgi:hypothetical protein